LAHWQEILGDRLLVIDYEELTTDPDRLVPLLLEHCGLPLEAAVFDTEATGGAVRTASVAQIRRPISPVGVGVSEPYLDAMSDFVANYRA
jgi:hypothetical protein